MTSTRSCCTDMDVAIGARLRDFRRMAGISQEKLAEAVGKTFQQIQKYESGRNRIALSTAVPLCQHLGISPMDLIGVYFGATAQNSDLVRKALVEGRAAQSQIAEIRRVIVLGDTTRIDIPEGALDGVAFAGVAAAPGSLRILDDQLVTQ